VGNGWALACPFDSSSMGGNSSSNSAANSTSCAQSSIGSFMLLVPTMLRWRVRVESASCHSHNDLDDADFRVGLDEVGADLGSGNSSLASGFCIIFCFSLSEKSQP